METKLYKICEEILKSEEETKKFLSYETIDDLYEYFLSKVPGLTEEEFDKFIGKILNDYEKDQENITKLKKESLDNVSGGAFNFRARFVSGALAIMSMIPVASAADINKMGAPLGVPQNVSMNEKLNNKSSGVFQRAKAWVKAHPKLAAGLSVGAILLISLVGVHAYKRLKDRNQPGVSARAGGAEDLMVDAYQGDMKDAVRKKKLPQTKGDFLIQYAKEGNTEEIKNLLESGDLDINYHGEHGKTALIVAVEAKQIDTVKFLLSKKADVDSQDSDGYTAIMHAAMTKTSKEIIKLLFNAHAILNIIGKDGNNVLTLAAEAGNKDLFDIVRKEDVDEDLSDSEVYVYNGLRSSVNRNGDTPLICAARGGHAGIVETLLRYVADDVLNRQNKSGDTALICAARCKEDGKETEYAKTLDLLLAKGADPNKANKYGDTALICAARNGSKNISDKLLSYVNYETRDSHNKDGDTALICAARNGHKDIVGAFLSLWKGVDKNAQNAVGDTALICAARNGHRGVVEKLLGYSKIAHINKNGESALTCASKNGQSDIVKYLLDNSKTGISINDKQDALEKASDDNSKIFLQESLLRDKLEESIKTWKGDHWYSGWNRQSIYKLSVNALNNGHEDNIWNADAQGAVDAGFAKAVDSNDYYKEQLETLQKLLQDFRRDYGWVPCEA